MQKNFIAKYFQNCISILTKINKLSIEKTILILIKVRKNSGRLFILGSGGGAGHASHAVNDFRKIAGLESYCPSDNVSELTARINDEGWENCYADWLQASRLNQRDCILIFSVGGGCKRKNVSINLVKAMVQAKKRGAKICAITGKDGGEAKKLADALILVPNVAPEFVTPLTESMQAIIWHLIVSHPKIQINKTKW